MSPGFGVGGFLPHGSLALALGGFSLMLRLGLLFLGQPVGSLFFLAAGLGALGFRLARLLVLVVRDPGPHQGGQVVVRLQYQLASVGGCNRFSFGVFGVGIL